MPIAAPLSQRLEYLAPSPATVEEAPCCLTCAAPVCGQTPVSPPHSQPHSSHLGAVRSGAPRQGTLGWQPELLPDEPELPDEPLPDDEEPEPEELPLEPEDEEEELDEPPDEEPLDDDEEEPLDGWPDDELELLSPDEEELESGGPDEDELDAPELEPEDELLDDESQELELDEPLELDDEELLDDIFTPLWSGRRFSRSSQKPQRRRAALGEYSRFRGTRQTNSPTRKDRRGVAACRA